MSTISDNLDRTWRPFPDQIDWNAYSGRPQGYTHFAHLDDSRCLFLSSDRDEKSVTVDFYSQLDEEVFLSLEVFPPTVEGVLEVVDDEDEQSRQSVLREFL